MIVLCIKPDKIGFPQIAPFIFFVPQKLSISPQGLGWDR